MATSEYLDAGQCIWNQVYRALETDEIAFKSKIYKIYDQLKSGLFINISKGIDLTMDDIVEAEMNISWKSDQFSNLTLMYLTSAVTDSDHKAMTSIHIENVYRDMTPYLNMKRVHVASLAYELAMSKLELGRSTVLSISLLDYQANKGQSRTKTFSHLFTLAMSVTGVYMFQAFGGSGGYTLKEHMDRLPCPRSHTEGREFANKLTALMKLSVDHDGRWSQEANMLYQELFHVNLNARGSMSVGCQFDPFLSVEIHDFNVRVVHDNFTKFLPKCKFRKSVIDEVLLARRGEMKEGRSSISHRQLHLRDIVSDGRFDHHSTHIPELFTDTSPAKVTDPSNPIRIRIKIPKFIDYPETSDTPLDFSMDVCAYCNFSSNLGMAQCTKCNITHYCCHEHQRKHWKIHKDECISVWADLAEKL
jgi:hypothetical protein